MQGLFEGFKPYILSGVTISDQKLGTGAYATVLKLDYMGLKCAGKKIHEALLGQGSAISYTVNRFRSECEILSQLRHPNIIQFLGIHLQQEEHVPILVMEFLPFTLTQCLNTYSLQEEISYYILHGVALGLHYLHSQPSPIIHRDLSSNNVLLSFDMSAKISDLGVARILNLPPQITPLTQTPGTPAFMPPEVMVAKPKYDTSVDVFSYGIMMIHVFSGKWPEPQLGPNRTEGGKLIPISEAERREEFLLAIGKDHPLMELILKCIQNSPPMRADSSEIVKQLAVMIEQFPTSFANRLEMINYINELENKSKLNEMQMAQQGKELIAKFEQKEEDNQSEMKILIDTMEQAIDNLKSSLREEVTKVMAHVHQPVIQDLKEHMKDIEVDNTQQTSEHKTTISKNRLHESKQRDYENIMLTSRGTPRKNVRSRHTRSVSDMQSTVTQPSIESEKEKKSNVDANEDDTVQHEASVHVNPPLTIQETKKVSDTGKREPKTVQEISMPSKTDVSKSMEEGLQFDQISESKPAINKKKRARPSSTSVDDATAVSRECDFQPSQSHSRQKSLSVVNTDNQKSPMQLRRSENNAKKVPTGPAVQTQTRIAKKDVAPSIKLNPKENAKPTPSKPRYVNTCVPQDNKDNSPKEDGLTKSLEVLAASEKKGDGQTQEKRRRRTTTVHAAHNVTDEQEKKTKPKWKDRLFRREDKSKSCLQNSSNQEDIPETCEDSVYDLNQNSQGKTETPTPFDLSCPIYTAMSDYDATSPSELSFKKGDQMHIISKGKGKTWKARLTVGIGKEGNIPKSHVSALEEEKWFFGKLDVNSAKDLVMTSSNQLGSFLVRQNISTGAFSLTIRDQTRARHYHIHKYEDGRLYISQQCSFRSIHDLVDHHTLQADGLFTKLTKPCIAPHRISDREDVKLTDKLQSGQFSETWKGEWRGNIVTVNEIKTNAVTQVDLLDKCAFLTTLSHENLTYFNAIYIKNEPFLVITEHLEHRSLKDYLPCEGKDLNTPELIKISSQVAAAMSYLEKQNCIHQHLAAKNVMVEMHDDEEVAITCKLSVYPHLHKVSGYGATYTPPAGSLPIRWSSHKSIINNEINIKSNVWTFGILVWEIIHHCSSYPYPEMSEMTVLEKLQQGYRMPRPLGCQEELYELMTECWKEEADCRPTFETLHWQLDEFYSSDRFGYQYVEPTT